MPWPWSTEARRAGPVHALMMAMRRGHPHLILDCCRLWAKRSGDLFGPNPIDPRLAWVLENRRLALRYDRLGLINQSCSAPVYSSLQARLFANSENRLLRVVFDGVDGK